MDTRWVAGEFFDLKGWELARLFPDDQPVWATLATLGEAVAELAGGARPGAMEGVWCRGDVWLGAGVCVEPGVMIHGPAWIGDGAVIRQGAYLRGAVVVGEGAVVGHCSELKNAVLLPGAAAPHFNYVGDSILGRQVNLGAGTVLSNVALRRGEVTVRAGGERIPTGLHKFGAVLGDGSQTGCHVVLNPGTVAGRGVWFYPQVCAAGHWPAGAVVRGPVMRRPGRGVDE